MKKKIIIILIFLFILLFKFDFIFLYLRMHIINTLNKDVWIVKDKPKNNFENFIKKIFDITYKLDKNSPIHFKGGGINFYYDYNLKKKMLSFNDSRSILNCSFDFPFILKQKSGLSYVKNINYYHIVYANDIRGNIYIVDDFTGFITIYNSNLEKIVVFGGRTLQSKKSIFNGSSNFQIGKITYYKGKTFVIDMLANCIRIFDEHYNYIGNI